MYLSNEMAIMDIGITGMSMLLLYSEMSLHKFILKNVMSLNTEACIHPFKHSYCTTNITISIESG